MQPPNQYIEICLEGENSPFRSLSRSEKESIYSHHSVQQSKRGEYIFRQGEKARGILCLAEGKAKIFNTGVGGREQIMKMLKPGDLFGFQALFSESGWTESSVSIENSVICILDKQYITKLLRSNPEVSVRFCEILTGELAAAFNKMISLSQKHVRGRLAESILMLAGIYGFDADGRTINASLSRNDIAHLSNMTTSNAIRTLSSFASEGVIGIRGKKIVLLDHEKLEQISEQA